MIASNAHSSDLEPVALVPLREGRRSEISALQLHLKAANIESFVSEVSSSDNDEAVVRLEVPVTRLETAQQIAASLDALGDVTRRDSVEDVAKLPLSWGIRIVAFLIPAVAGLSLVILFVARSNFINRGLKRRADEWCFWYCGGFVFWMAVLFIWVALSSKATQPANPIVQRPAIILTSPPSATGL